MYSAVPKVSYGQLIQMPGGALRSAGKPCCIASEKRIMHCCAYTGIQLRKLKQQYGFPKVFTQGSMSRSYLSFSKNQWSTFAKMDETPFWTRESVYVFHSDAGGQVKAFVRRVDMVYKVTIQVSCLRDDDFETGLKLRWGIFRSDSSKWVTLDAQSIPEGTTISSAQNKQAFMQTLFQKCHEGFFALDLSFESDQVPFFVSFVLESSSDNLIRTHLGRNFCVPVGFGRGKPSPLGFYLGKDGHANFALYSRAAENVVLCLYDATSTEPCLQIELDPYVHRTGSVWHISMETLGPYTRYGYQCKGDVSWENGNRFHARRVLLDPYSKITAPFVCGQDVARSPASYLGWLVEEPEFDWENDMHPDLSLEDLLVYRLNIDGFSSDSSSGLPRDRRGTFLGVIDKLQHFKNLGVNAILLEPIFAFSNDQGAYCPYNFFAPASYFGPMKDCISASVTFKQMVKACHANGIEVIMEVVYTHTAEGGDADPHPVSFRGIDNATYYILNENNEVAGDKTQNRFNCNHPVVQKLIIDSLQHWLNEYHIDGFCFSNSSALTKGQQGNSLSRPPLVETIAFDPLLSRTKIIMDPCLPSTGLSNGIRFPHWKRWAEFNIRYRDDVRSFLRGDKGQLSNFATRLCGSGDLFTDGRGPSFSFNFITQNFGLSLVDLVSFSDINGSQELSWNCGEEGPTKNKVVLETRLKQIRNFLFILFISLGVPVLNMGDEYGQTTGGSTLLSDRAPFKWNALESEFAHQAIQFIHFLRDLRMNRKYFFQRKRFTKIENLAWHGVVPEQPQWEDPDNSFLAMTVNLENGESESKSMVGDIYLAFNAYNVSKNVSLPQLPDGTHWFRLIDTSLPFPETLTVEDSMNMSEDGFLTYEVKSHSCVLFEAHARE